MTTSWRSLRPGEPVGIVALSGPVDPVKLGAGTEWIRNAGHPLIEAPNLLHRKEYLAGDDRRRLAGLQYVLERGARWIFAARGGFGVTRLLPFLPWDDLLAEEVRFVGFSDLTALLNPLFVRGHRLQIHGPMVCGGLTSRDNGRRLLTLLRRGPDNVQLFGFRKDQVVRQGSAIGPAIGGNLATLVALQGTPWEIPLDGAVLFLEDVGEPFYRLDRMLTQLSGSASFPGVKALIGGSLHRCRPARQRNELWRCRLREIAPPGVPVVVNLPFGHGARNIAFPIGAPVEVNTRAMRVTWRS